MLFFPEVHFSRPETHPVSTLVLTRCALHLQGTRSASGKMAEFKKGAFTVAAKETVPVVPVTLDGTGRLMRNGACASAAVVLRMRRS